MREPQYGDYYSKDEIRDDPDLGCEHLNTDTIEETAYFWRGICTDCDAELYEDTDPEEGEQ